MFATVTLTSLPYPRARRCLAVLLVLVTVLLGSPPAPGGHAALGVAAGGDSLAGRLLVATENMGDPRFRNTVIYMVQHDADGAMGLIVNVPFGAMPLASLFERLGLEASEVAGEIQVHYGGPVAPERGFLLHSAEVVLDHSILLGEGVAMTAEAEMLHRVARGEGPENSLFAFGYSGWAPNQLESEFERDSWFTIPFDSDLVFADDPARSWERAAARRGLDL